MNMDLVVQAPRNPKAGETLAGTGFKMIPGGKGANQAVAASRAGANTHMVGYVGEDIFGRILLDSLSDAGVNVERCQRLPEISTGIANIVVEPNGENRIIIVAGANGCVTMEMLENYWAYIRNSALVILQHEIPLLTIHTIIKRCAGENIPVLFNPAPFYPIPEEVAALVDIFVLNETEAGGLAEMVIDSVEAANKAARTLLKNEKQSVIITLGKDGAVLLNHSGSIYQPAFKVTAVDTTAAGDTFVGGYAASRLEGKTASECLKYAVAASALAVTKLGAQTSIPTRAEVEKFIQNQQ